MAAGGLCLWRQACVVDGQLDGPLQNVTGKIALIARGTCEFTSKVPRLCVSPLVEISKVRCLVA
jgi:hypothetical protein